MPQQPGDRIPKAWTEDSILTLVEPKIRTLIRRAGVGDLGGGPIDHGSLGGLADDDHVQYLIDLPSTGGDGITVTTRTIAVDLTDNTIMAKVGAAAAGPLSVPANTIVLRAGGDIEALLMPHVFDVSGSLLVRDGNNPTTDIKALVVPKNSVPVTNTAGNWVARNFTPNANIVADAQGGLSSTIFNANRWVITTPLGVLSDLLAITDWMLVGVNNVPAVLISAANALVGKFGSSATAFNVVNANEIVLRAGGNLDGFLVGVQEIIGRKSADIVAHAFIDNSLLGKITGDWGNIGLAVQQLILRGASDMAATTIGDTRWVGRPVGGNLGEVTPAQSRVMLALKYNSFLVPPGLHVGTVTIKTDLIDDRTYFHYVGKAGGAITTCVIVTEVATVFNDGLVFDPWAQVGIFVGAFGTGATTVTRVGFTDVALTFTSLGRKVTVVALTGVSEGDDLWVAFGSHGQTNFQLRGLLPDKIRSGVVRKASVLGDLDELADPTTASLESDIFTPAWVGVAI